MLTALIKDRVYFKVFDKSFKQSSHIYYDNKTDDVKKLTKIGENLAAIKLALKCSNLLILNQIHGNVVIDADQMEFGNVKPSGDASITTERGLALAVLTADCVPVLLSCEEGSAIGAAHCGWRGAKAGIIDNLVVALKNKGVKNIKAIVGPAIQQFSYEVDHLYYQDFVNQQKNYSKFFTAVKHSNRYLFNLPGFVEWHLKEVGISDILMINENTYDMQDKYPSYRRSTHQNVSNTQRILSAIVIK